MIRQEASPRIGVFGGTFDPIHIAHLISVEEVRFRLSLESILFVPNRQPPHKSGPVTRFEDRVAMVRLAVGSNPFFSIELAEIERSGPSFALDTMRQIRHRYGSGAYLAFILGFDALVDLESWHEPDSLLSEFDLVTMDRPSGDGNDQAVREREWEKLSGRFPGIRSQVRTVHVPQLEITSHDIRERLRLGEPVRYQVPMAVEDYLRERGLYADSP